MGTWGRSCWVGGWISADRAFVFKQPLLAVEAAAIAGQRAVGADDAVAGDDNADRVGTVGSTRGTDCGWFADALRQIGIGNGLASGMRRSSRQIFCWKSVPPVSTLKLSMMSRSPLK